jgi:hypothetical protein
VRFGGVPITFGEEAGRTFDGYFELILFGQIISFYQDIKKIIIQFVGLLQRRAMDDKHDIDTQNPSYSYRN